MENIDISPETQRTLINLMLAALGRLNNRGHGGFTEVDEFDVSPEIQRQFIKTAQGFAEGIQLGVRGGPPPPPKNCEGLLQALEQEIRALGGVPVKSVKGWEERFANCPEQQYNEAMSLLGLPNRR